MDPPVAVVPGTTSASLVTSPDVCWAEALPKANDNTTASENLHIVLILFFIILKIWLIINLVSNIEQFEFHRFESTLHLTLTQWC